MNPIKAKIKKKLCKQHRQEYYGRTLDRLMAGKCSTTEVTYRWGKLKEIDK